MFVCKICDKEYDDNMRYSRDSRYCAVCALWRSQMRFSTAAMRSRTAARI